MQTSHEKVKTVTVQKKISMKIKWTLQTLKNIRVYVQFEKKHVYIFRPCKTGTARINGTLCNLLTVIYRVLTYLT